MPIMLDLKINWKFVRRGWYVAFQLCVLLFVIKIFKALNYLKILDLSNACSIYNNYTYRVMPKSNVYGMIG